MASGYIGAKISLISKSDIRYVGTLHSIDQEESTIALENVKSLGTEDRRSESDGKLEASDATFEYIKFRAADVKDLHVEESAPPKPRSEVPNDPAIITSTYKQPQPTQPSSLPNVLIDTQQTNAYNGSGHTANPSQFRDRHHNDPNFANARRGSRDNAFQERGNDVSDDLRADRLPGMGGHLLHGRRDGRGNARFDHNNNNRSRPPQTPVPTTDFDFESSNAKFSKDGLEKEIHGKPENDDDVDEGKSPSVKSPTEQESETATLKHPPSEVFYAKSGFFDNISCETKERQRMDEEGRHRGGERRAQQFQERRLNLETFGQMTIDGNRNRRNFRGRGGHRNAGHHGGHGNGGFAGQQGRREDGGRGQGSFRGHPNRMPQSQQV